MITPTLTNQRLTSDEAADYLGVTRPTLRNWRCTSRYEIPYYRIGAKVVYHVTDLHAWIASRRVGEPVQN